MKKYIKVIAISLAALSLAGCLTSEEKYWKQATPVISDILNSPK